MNKSDIEQLIENKNYKRVNDMYRNAEGIIESIVFEQGKITISEIKIKELREELKALSVTELNPTTILGEV